LFLTDYLRVDKNRGPEVNMSGKLRGGPDSAFLLCALLGAACGSDGDGGSGGGSGGGSAGTPDAAPAPGGEQPAPGGEQPAPGGEQPVTPDAALPPTPDATLPPTPDAALSPTPDAAVAPPPDAALSPPPDAAVAPPPTPDAAVAPPPDAAVPPPPPPGDGPAETCEGAPFLAERSVPMEIPAGGLTHVTSAPFGASNDYNPLQGAGLPPACSFVYDARGLDVVYAVHLEPGQTLVTRTVIEPDGLPAGIYLLEDCATGDWPDVDGSTLCGDNEYHTQGRCNFGFCDPLEWRLTWPAAINGVPTAAHTFFVVVDQVEGDAAEGFTLEWGLLCP
jgi:hypothetical protein